MYKVLVVEDEAIIRQGLIQSIDWEAHDCRIVAEAKNGIEALKQIESHMPDIILLDVNMPLMGGMELLSKIDTSIISTIIISGYSEFEYAKQAIKYNVVDYLLKPIDPNNLISALEKAKTQIEMRASYQKPETDPYQVLERKNVDSVSLTKVIEFIEAHIKDRITMHDLTELTEKSASSINNRFQREYNMSFTEYLTKARIQRAIDLIQEVEMPLYKIAELVGFNEYKYFSQVFKKVTGVSPKMVQLYYLRKQK